MLRRSGSSLASGGGLFDNRGNLVGITTLTVPGEKKLNHSLNFAIAADPKHLAALRIHLLGYLLHLLVELENGHESADSV